MNINLNRKGIMTLEGLEQEEMIVADEVSEVTLHDPEELVENSLLQAQEIGEETAAQSDEIAEGEGIAETLDDITEHMDATVGEDGEGISEPVAQALTAAVEHFKARLGYTGSLKFPAMESFSNKDSRVAATKLAISQNQKLVTGIHTALAVAHEGFLDNLKYKFKLFFTNEQKLLKRLKEVSTAYDKTGAKEEPLQKPPFAKFFNPSGKDHISSKDVAGIVASYRAIFSNDALIKLVQQTEKALTELVTALKKTNFVADDAELEKIKELIDEVTALEKEVKQVTDSGRKFNDDADFEPIGADDKKQLVSDIDAILVDDQLEKAVGALIDAYYAAESASTSNLEGAGNNSVGGQVFNLAVGAAMALKKDVQLAKQAIQKAYAILEIVGTLSDSNLEVCHAGISYIALSTKTGG